MKAFIKNHAGCTVVQLKGAIDYETPEKVILKLKDLLNHIDPQNIFLDMQNLDFVGSSGIEKFKDSIEKTFGSTAKCIGLKNEFKRCFKVFSNNKDPFRYFTTLDEAIANFDNESCEDDLESDENSHNC